MEFLENIEDIKIVEEEIAHFVADTNGYYAIAKCGLRIDITSVFTIQPPIDDFNDYFAFMFVESLHEYFLFRQRVYEGRPLKWEVYLKINAVDRNTFFARAQECWSRIKESE